MTDTIADDIRDLSLPDAPIIARGLGRLMPQNLRQLAWFCNQAAASGLFKTAVKGGGQRPLTGGEAFLLASQGIELGLSPLQALRELNLIDGRVDVPASVRAARIAASPKTTMWDADANDERCIIRAKRRDRENGCVVSVHIGNMPSAWRQRHADHISDALYARAVRRISRQYYPDLSLGIESDEWEQQRDPERVIDIARVEREAGTDDGAYGRHEDCGGDWQLHANTKTGGAFLRCERCNATAPPPDIVRDVIRGRSDELRPAEEVMPDTRDPARPAITTEGDSSAVQSESDLPPSPTEHERQEIEAARHQSYAEAWRGHALEALFTHFESIDERQAQHTIRQFAVTSESDLSINELLHRCGNDALARLIHECRLDIPSLL